MVERIRNASKKYRRQFCYVIKILFSSNHLDTSIWADTIKLFAFYLIHIWIIFISNNIPENNRGAPLLGLTKSIYYLMSIL